ncbi:hypothetical protein CWI84_01840 [Idiomarina tyrosinivorans]|uniref:CAAX prenyl protease 2/Lysostaphin resistance protein A-like domain-containing protein n=1 Tax=Idiomarina tyrosinivorans TaxID=1445662 RepID=A0A432ZUK4_9GAMM|nr:CPBP family intramembrane glutamic endopeptidase [Idiomarina tyrosinivorans]RUO81522.1 hypothetical protein CWI84_01840 [Idiomarina tyrosinivorans]
MRSTKPSSSSIKPGDLLAGQLILAAIAVVTIYWFDTPVPIPVIGNLNALCLGVAFAGLSFLLIIVGLNGPKWLAKPLQQQVQFVYPIVAEFNALRLTALALAAGVSEELLFRVALQYWSVEWFGTLLGVLAIALLFALLHCMSWTYVATTFVIGLALGSAYAYWQSIALVVSWHFCYDLLALFALRYFPEKLGLDIKGFQETANQ